MEKKELTKAVYIPKTGRNDTERYVAVNGKRILVRTGELVELPIAFAEVVEESQRMEASSEEYIASNRREDTV